MKITALALTLLVYVSQDAIAQIRKQVFAGTGCSFPVVGDLSPTVTAGGALIIPIHGRFFARPAAVVSSNFPDSGKPTLQAQALGFLGLQVSKRFAVLGGGGEAFLFPEGKPSLHLATVTTTTATTIRQTAHGKFGLFTPISHNAKGWGAGLLLGYTW